jgi:hypothetical protein
MAPIVISMKAVALLMSAVTSQDVARNVEDSLVCRHVSNYGVNDGGEDSQATAKDPKEGRQQDEAHGEDVPS